MQINKIRIIGGITGVLVETRKRIMQANINNQGGAFSVAYEAQKKLKKQYVFDYFSAENFVKNEIYEQLLSMGSRCIGGIECKNRLLKQYEIYKTFKSYLKKNRYEYVHIHADTAWKILVYYYAAKSAGIKNIVVHSHSSGINGHYKKLNYFLHLIAKPIIKKAKYRCACSDIAAIWMFDTTSNVNIIRNGVDIERYKFNKIARDKIREELDIQHKTVIGSVSDFSYQKNPEFIYDIMNVFKSNSNYIFLMVGNRKKCLLKEYVDKEGINNVIFMGTVTNIQDYLSAMDIFILPSRFEGLPMCALEAQVSGLITIVSDRITSETKCSKYFFQLKLDVNEWKNKIESVDLVYNREKAVNYLDAEKANSSNMADEFKKIYAGRG